MKPFPPKPTAAHEILNYPFATLSCGDLPPPDPRSEGRRSIIERLPDIFEMGPGDYRFMAGELAVYAAGRYERRFFIVTLIVELGIPQLTVEELIH